MHIVPGLAMSSEKRRPVPVPRSRSGLRIDGRPESFTPTPRHREMPTELPRSSAVLEMTLRDLVRWCDKLDVPDHGLATEEQYRHSLLQHVLQRSRRSSQPNSVPCGSYSAIRCMFSELSLFFSHLEPADSTADRSWAI